MSRLRSNFQVVSQDSLQMTLRDLGPWDQFMTITNNAEDVVRYCHEKLCLGDRRLQYEDSEGVLTELLHDGPVFRGFSSP